jgi:hypothetical protein
MTPGDTLLTLIVGPYSWAAPLTRATTPALAAD